MRTSEQKFRDLILYVCLRSEGDEWFGATKLNKLLFFIDLGAFRQFGQTISGQEYEKREFGPVPVGMQSVLRVLRDANAIVTRTAAVSGYPQHRTFALREPDLSEFEPREIVLIERVLSSYRQMTATQIADASHAELGWRSVAYYETIPFGFGLISERPLTEAERAYAKELADMSELDRVYAS